MALPATMVWEIRADATASNANGGGFDSAYVGIGTDYSQQTGSQYGASNLASTNGTNATPTVTSATHTFTTADTGNIIYISAGTNWTAGRYLITSVSGGGAVLDRACGSVASLSGGTYVVGGALSLGAATDDAVLELSLPGHIWYVRGASGTITTGVTISIAAAGTTSLPIKMIGYNSTRGDNPTGSTRPLINCGTASITFGTAWWVSFISFTSTSSVVVGSGNGNIFWRVRSVNTSATAGRSAFNNAGQSCTYFSCEGVSLRGYALITATNVYCLNCNFHDSDIGIRTTTTVNPDFFLNCVVHSNVTGGFLAASAQTSLRTIYGCTFYGGETPIGIGIDFATGNIYTKLNNNIIYGFVTGTKHADATNSIYADYNNYFNNTTNRSNIMTGGSDIALNPAFTNVSQISGSTAISVAGNIFRDTTKDFSALGVSADVSYLYIISGTGVTVGKYAITTVGGAGNSDLTVTPALTADATADKVYRITVGYNFAVGSNMQAVGMPASPFAGISTTSYVDIGAIQRKERTSADPGIANVKTGVGYTINDSSLTGTYTGSDRYSDPGTANVLTGTNYIFNAVTLTGSLPAGATYTDPGTTNVRLNTSYIFNNVTQTGSLVVPTPASGTAGSVDISYIKEQIRFVLDATNTTTGSPIDLSNNLTTRVKQVMKVNPEKIRVDVQSYPCVTVFTSKKNIELKTIAKDQVTGKRKCGLVFTIVGMVWNDSTADYREDAADEDVEILMENVEVVLRHHTTLNSSIAWQFPSDITYHTVPYDEQTHMRVGVMELQATLYY